MVKLYVLPTKEDQATLKSGGKPGNCLVREFDTPLIAQAYYKGLLIGYQSNVIRESYLKMMVVFGGSDSEEKFDFDTIEEKSAFRQGLEDGEGYTNPMVYDDDSDLFPALETMFSSDVKQVFIRCDEGSLGLLKSFGAKLAEYDAMHHGATAEVSAHVLEQINQFPADFEIDFDFHDETIEGAATVVESPEENTAQNARNATLYFLRQERAKVTTVGILSASTTLPSDAEVKQALIDATTEWVSKTEQGRKLWARSSEDLNIGDLVSSGAFSDAVLLAALRQRGVDFNDCTIGGTEDAISYDQVLVDPANIEGKQIQIPFMEACA